MSYLKTVKDTVGRFDNITEVTEAHSMSVDEYYVVATSGTFTITLPSSSLVEPGHQYVVKNNGTGAITVSGGADEIDGSTDGVVLANGEFLFVVFVSVSTGWINVGSPSVAYVEKTGTYTITSGDYLINCTSGTFTLTLPAAGNLGKEYVIKNSGTGVITVDGDGSETIDDATTIQITPYSSRTLVDIGTEWIIV